jgi:hypothetical protein
MQPATDVLAYPQARPIITKVAKEFAEAREHNATSGAQALADECLAFNKIPNLDLAEFCFGLDYLASTPLLGLEEQAEMNRINYTIRKMDPGILKLRLTKDKHGIR